MQRGQVAVVTVVLVGALLVGAAFATDGNGPVSPDASLDAPTVGPDATSIDSCTTITKPGTYVLASNITEDKSTRLSESCITIRARDVVFDGRGHRVEGNGISDTRGVEVSARNVTVRNVVVAEWERGVYYRNATGGTVTGVVADSNGFGIDLDWSRGVRVVDNDVEGNLVGLDLARGNARLVVRDNRVQGNHVTDRLQNESAESA
jgi:hypothetical protein